jgi:mono/diheme cytochrome c family protein
MGGYMKCLSRIHLVWCLLFGLTGMAVAVAAGQEGRTKPQPDQKNKPLIASVQGPDLFRAYCAPCHGDDGKGNGPVAPALNAKPADLTTIAQRNGGVFPSKRVRDIISGDDVIVAHGSREMPVWGPIFHQIEWDRDLGDVRLRNIVKYLESIQGK